MSAREVTKEVRRNLPPWASVRAFIRKLPGYPDILLDRAALSSAMFAEAIDRRVLAEEVVLLLSDGTPSDEAAQ